MKVRYDPETDIVLCEISKKRIVHTEEQGPIIIHFDSNDHPVLLEIQGGSKFIGELARLALFARGDKAQSTTI